MSNASPRFTEAQMREIFARAARLPAPASEAEPAFTLDELQQIGASAGLDPARVAAAAASLASGDRPLSGPAPAVWGMPTEIRGRRVLPGEVDDAAWEAMVASLRETYGGPGTSGQTGRVREWTSPGPFDGGASGSRSGDPVHVTARPLDGGHTEVALDHLKARQASQVVQALAVVFGGIALGVGGVLTLLGGLTPEVLVLVAVNLAVALAALAVGIPAVRASVGRRRAQLDATLDRLDLIARRTAPSTEAPIASPAPSGAASSGARVRLPDDPAPASASDAASDRVRTG